MATTCLKLGTSVADVERIQAVAKRIAASKEDGNDLVIVVSAMGHTTDELTGLARAISSNPPQREMDMLLATGEQVSIALLSMALHAEGIPAVSMTGPQVGILTESAHGRARILEIKTERVRRLLDDGNVVVVAGFQGTSNSLSGVPEITTLGRGGSDTSAVALAAAIGADAYVAGGEHKKRILSINTGQKETATILTDILSKTDRMKKDLRPIICMDYT